MDKETQNRIEDLLGYVMRTDARFMGLQMALSDILKLDAQQKADFDNSIEAKYKICYGMMLEQAEKQDAGLAARLIDGQNPYQGLV